MVGEPVGLGARFGERRYRLALYRSRWMGRKTDIQLDERGVCRLSRLVGDRPKPAEVRSDPLEGEVCLLSETERRKLGRVLALLEGKR